MKNTAQSADTDATHLKNRAAGRVQLKRSCHSACLTQSRKTRVEHCEPALHSHTHLPHSPFLFTCIIKGGTDRSVSSLLHSSSLLCLTLTQQLSTASQLLATRLTARLLACLHPPPSLLYALLDLRRPTFSRILLTVHLARHL